MADRGVEDFAADLRHEAAENFLIHVHFEPDAAPDGASERLRDLLALRGADGPRERDPRRDDAARLVELPADRRQDLRKPQYPAVLEHDVQEPRAEVVDAGLFRQER